MKQQWLPVLILYGLLLASCRGADMPAATPTPFPTITAVAPEQSVGIQPITLAELMADPALYQNQQLQITGQFYRLPRIICDSPAAINRSPAGWSLREGEMQLLGGGLGSAVEVAPVGLTMTVNGRLLRWQGPVGCGKRAVFQEIWYLEASRVVSPRPVTNATLTPAAIIADIDVQGQLLGQATPTPTFTATPDDDDLTDEPPPAPEPPDATPMPTFTPTPDAEDEQATPTPTPTPDENGAEATATPTPDPDAAADPGTVVEKGELISGELFGGRLDAGEVHWWRFAIEESDFLTVTAVANQGNLILVLLDEEANTLHEQNDAPAQAVESILNFELDEPGDYILEVRTDDNVTADYGLLFMLSDSYTFVMFGLINYDQQRPNIILEADSDHVWHFAGTAGDQITVLATPQDDMDPFLELYGPDGELISDFIDEGVAGEAEELVFTLPETGLYAIRLGEIDFEAGLYTIRLTRN
jgi:hypothetical protein